MQGINFNDEAVEPLAFEHNVVSKLASFLNASYVQVGCCCAVSKRQKQPSIPAAWRPYRGVLSGSSYGCRQPNKPNMFLSALCVSQAFLKIIRLYTDTHRHPYACLHARTPASAQTHKLAKNESVIRPRQKERTLTTISCSVMVIPS
jgi:hypothetical protein